MGSKAGGRGGGGSFPAVAVIVPAVIAVVVLALLAALLLWRRRKRNSKFVKVWSPTSSGRSGRAAPWLPPASSSSLSEGTTAAAAAAASAAAAAAAARHLSRDEGDSYASSSSKSGGRPEMVIRLDVIRAATDDFADCNIIGRGGFGTVYQGTLEDGTKVAVKRMEVGPLRSKGLREFQAEIGVLTKVRHRHLVALLGYVVDGYERLLAYEYLSQGPLSRHLFEHARRGLRPLTWPARVSVALDVARGVEYLHSLARHASFIHRDLKPSNVLLDESLRAKVSDFGLAKHTEAGARSIETRLAGTFGYLAPEYAVTGRVTTKADVYSFGVILMELITGQRALDESLGEERAHLAAWFPSAAATREGLAQIVDPAMAVDAESFEALVRVAGLACHCTVRQASQRPQMSDAVAVLTPLVQQWKPQDPLEAEMGGIDTTVSLKEALQQWQAMEDGDDLPGAYIPAGGGEGGGTGLGGNGAGSVGGRLHLRAGNQWSPNLMDEGAASSPSMSPPFDGTFLAGR